MFSSVGLFSVVCNGVGVGSILVCWGAIIMFSCFVCGSGIGVVVVSIVLISIGVSVFIVSCFNC